jgi:hypothetical protein
MTAPTPPAPIPDAQLDAWADHLAKAREWGSDPSLDTLIEIGEAAIAALRAKIAEHDEAVNAHSVAVVSLHRVLSREAELRAEVEALKADHAEAQHRESGAVQMAAVAQWMVDALNGCPVSDFAESFHEVVLAMQVRAERDALHEKTLELSARLADISARYDNNRATMLALAGGCRCDVKESSR